jgi:hypothetical protein
MAGTVKNLLRPKLARDHFMVMGRVAQRTEDPSLRAVKGLRAYTNLACCS